MSFTAYSFAVFLLVVLLAYYAIANRRWQIRLLIVASYVFYGWWDWRFCGLILLSTVVDFTAARRLYAAPVGSLARRGWLATSLAVNLGALGFFKYFNFFVESAEAALQAA